MTLFKTVSPDLHATSIHVPKRFAVRDSVCLNGIYEYKEALLPFVKSFWVPRLDTV